ncbi:helix-turn-helix domain-containing protein [Wenjunlia vitaminophila]|nr:helix-turn-helix transcriptional regulator [Wenjunlia vitaminophila]
MRSPRVMFAAELARLRTDSGRSLRELADEVGWDHTHLHNVERGKSLGGPELVEALDTVYGTSPLLVRLWELAQQGATFRDKYKRYMQLEAEATGIEQYAGSYFPGLLQTEAYARALLWSTPHRAEHEPELEEQLTARLGRQALLTGGSPPFLRTILDEAVLRRSLPHAEAWREQLTHLTEMSALPHVTVQVLPFAAGPHDLLGGSLTLVRRRDGRTAAWLESSKSGELVADAEEAEQRFRLSYDALRDMALSPRESVAFIEHLVKEG